MNALVDSFGRQHTYLRISVTDRCNLRCVYCMPPEGIPLKARHETLTLEEIEKIARVFVDMGITKIRITGGEPLLRQGVEQLIANLRKIDGLKTLAMTTNAVLLKDKVQTLKVCGLDALNISLDSLQKERFSQITLRDDLDNVMAAIDAVIAADFQSVKINIVVIAGRNDDELLDFIKFFRDKKVNIRFIEYMPFKNNQWVADEVFSYAAMRQIIESEYKLNQLPTEAGAVAKDFAIEGYPATVSFVTSMTDSFCSSCNRLRLMADGGVKSCLFYAPEINIRDLVRSGAEHALIKNYIEQAVLRKPEAHPPMEELSAYENKSMVEIGG